MDDREIILKVAMATLGVSRQGKVSNEICASMHTDAIGTPSFDVATVATQSTHVVMLKSDVSKDWTMMCSPSRTFSIATHGRSSEGWNNDSLAIAH